MCMNGQSCPTLCDPMDCSPPGSEESIMKIDMGVLIWLGKASLRKWYFSQRLKDGEELSKIKFGGSISLIGLP